MADNKWKQPQQPPPPLFMGKKERDLVKQVNDELVERVIGEQILYYPISIEDTDFHPVYGESMQKTFLNPIRVHAMIEWKGYETESTNLGIDRKAKITVHFHKRRLTEDQDLFVREGDFVLYGDDYYEIMTLNEPKRIFGQVNHRMEITAECVKAREGVFNAS